MSLNEKEKAFLKRDGEMLKKIFHKWIEDSKNEVFAIKERKDREFETKFVIWLCKRIKEIDMYTIKIPKKKIKRSRII